MTFNRLDSGHDSLCADKRGAQNLKHHTGSAEMSVSSLIEQLNNLIKHDKRRGLNLGLRYLHHSNTRIATKRMETLF